MPWTFRKTATGVLAALGLAAHGTALAQAAGAPAAPKLKAVWEPVNYGEDLSLLDVFFVTPETGYVSGAAGTILKTTDAGASWVALLGGDPQSEEREIKRLWFVNPTTGWAMQTTSTQTNLLRTTDGETWSKAGTISEHFDDIAFASGSDGLYVDDTQIFRTQDGGRTWRPVYQCVTRAEVEGLMRQIGCNLWKLRYATPSVVYALGAAIDVTAAVVVKSVDGGASWSAVAVLPEENGAEGGLFFLDENTGYLSTKDAKSAFRTTDGGLTWTGMPATSIGRSVAFADPGVGWALYYARLSYTTDGGKRWFSRDLPLPAMPNAFSLPRRDRGYVVGDHGMIYRYSVLPESAAVAARSLPAPAMPALDNTVLAQIQRLETRLGEIGAEVQAAGSAGPAADDWSSTAVEQELAQLQQTVETVASGVPQLGSRYRSLNLLGFGLELLGELADQGRGLKEAFAGLTKAQDPQAASAALRDLRGQLDAMKSSVETFQALRKPGS